MKAFGRRGIAASVAVIGLGLSSVGCGGTGSVVHETENSARQAAERAAEATQDVRQIRRAACRHAKVEESSRALRGEDPGDDGPC